MWAGRLQQVGEHGFAVLGLAKRTAALKGKLKGKSKGDQAQQPGAHAVPVDRGQEGQLIWKLRGATTASAHTHHMSKGRHGDARTLTVLVDG